MKYYVYLIRSLSHPNKIYAGYTTNIKERLKRHNSGSADATMNLRPWELVACAIFENMAKAKAFEWYLKSHSGRAFISKRLQ